MCVSCVFVCFKLLTFPLPPFHLPRDFTFLPSEPVVSALTLQATHTQLRTTVAAVADTLAIPPGEAGKRERGTQCIKLTFFFALSLSLSPLSLPLSERLLMMCRWNEATTIERYYDRESGERM